MNKPALFLDRDGVINVDHAYVHRKEDFEFIEGIFELCRYARNHGFLICVITNQAGIARGYYTEEDFLCLSDWMCQIFRGQGAPIDKVYFCPTHPKHGIGRYKVDSIFRKPGPGMILQAANDLSIDLSRSVLVGDKETDILAGIGANVHCNLLFEPLQQELPQNSKATAIVTNLVDVVPYLDAV